MQSPGVQPGLSFPVHRENFLNKHSFTEYNFYITAMKGRVLPALNAESRRLMKAC